ncbi:30S ribosomal protein S20 [Staphylococcus sp. SQ8-PEA]|uniref:Small ribosomal subunit protein bS20 n=1 Tax=Staphylococcus marylandisciuri TaxID=2981529 RepID=A0ABT2QQY2_9STAP|nr:30S ribosomal protein S20 [Staphylococcus marylandisciuri]MCU5746403.1 30S ribosomal protein S20 [Staphylococcus marylandisciuri]
MPNIKSAVKRVRKTEEAEHRNISQKNAMRTAIKRAKTAIKTDASEKDELIRFALKKIDKAAQRNLIHSNKADRIKSSLMSTSK